MDEGVGVGVRGPGIAVKECGSVFRVLFFGTYGLEFRDSRPLV